MEGSIKGRGLLSLRLTRNYLMTSMLNDGRGQAKWLVYGGQHLRPSLTFVAAYPQLSAYYLNLRLQC